jgi:hypothetical protein
LFVVRQGRKVVPARTQSKRPPGVPQGERTTTKTHVFRSKFEAAIFDKNPFLVYEPRKYTLFVIEPRMVALRCCTLTEETVTIPRFYTKRRRATPGYDPIVQKRLHTPDWEIPAEFSATGKVIVVESKGLLDEVSQDKILAFVESFPEVDYRLLFMRNNEVPKSKVTVTQWANHHRIPFAIGTAIPTSWLHPSVFATSTSSTKKPSSR